MASRAQNAGVDGRDQAIQLGVKTFNTAYTLPLDQWPEFLCSGRVLALAATQVTRCTVDALRAECQVERLGRLLGGPVPMEEAL
jgi:hypothetical protein